MPIRRPLPVRPARNLHRTINLLLHGTPREVETETERILETGIMDGGRFVMHEANNLAPRTPVENVAAMYEGTRKYGRYG